VPVTFRKKFNDQALQIISKEKNDSVNRVYYFKVAARYYNINAMEDYMAVSRKIIDVSRLKKDTAALAEGYSFLGDYFATKFISDSAYKNYNKSQKLYRAKREYSKAAKNLLNQSVIQFNEKDYVGSEKSAFEALKFLKMTDNQGLTYDALNLLGVIYGELNEYDKSLEYHNNALKLLKYKDAFPNPDLYRTSTLNNIGLIYQNKDDHKTAVSYFKQALSYDDLFTTDPRTYTFVINNLGYSELKLGELKQLPELFNKALFLSDSLGSVTSAISSKLHLSEYYALKKDTTKAYQLSVEAYKNAQSNRLAKEILLSLKQLGVVDSKNKASYSDQYIKLNDSLQLAERQTRNKLGRIEFETDQLATEKNQLIEQRKTLVYIGLGILLIGAFVFVIRVQAAKNRELRLIQEQQAANEEIYRLMITQQDKVEETRQAEKKRIAQEIHDGVLGKLFGTRMHLGLLNDSDGSEAKAERVTYIDELKTLEQELREISHDLNSEKQAVANNFVQMVTNFIETQRTVCKAAITITMDKKIDWTTVDSLAKINLYRILQEAFQNVNKHAQANTVAVSFIKQPGGILLTVKDDGTGFNFTKKKKGIGMLNMKARITGSGGTMTVITAPGEGTALQFELPDTAVTA
jgi:signal transduction histidine kinase